MKHVFVYGTLKSGYGNNSWMKDSELVTSGVTTDDFILTNCGFPYMIVPQRLSEGHREVSILPVVGEVWEVRDDVVRGSLDVLEGVSSGHYEQIEIEVQGDDGNVYNSIAYTPCHPDSEVNLPVCTITDEGFYQWP